ncbi:MAG: CHASE2 domain-containing protein [Burkholderiales bacterium]|nr:CHASE2 domain-containing protein [Burkholderiales bacterium]
MLKRTRILLRSAPVVVSIVTLLLFASLSAWDGWRRLELKGYDLLMVTSAPAKSSLPITIIGIDEPSFAQIGKQWPWPRRMHGELLDQLNRAGALVVAFDVLLSEPSNEEDDKLFAKAIAKAGNVVLTADLVYQENQYASQWLRVEPIDAFKAAGAANGLAAIPRDTDLVLRRMPEGRDVFWREIIRRVNLLRPGLLEEPPSLEGKMIGYVGPDHTFPYVSYYQALHADTDLPPDIFRDQIVLVGRNVKAAMETGGNDDNFATPFTGWTGWLTPGAEVHANALESALSRRSVTPLSWLWNFALLVFAIGASALLMRRWRPFLSGAVGLALLAIILFGDWWLFAQYNLWLPALAALVSVVMVYVGLGGHAFFSEQRQRRETRRAFSMYLAPEVVDQIMAHPDKLKLGGERREITLLFTDLKGFTNISEQLGPEQVAQLLNEHFSRATAIIKRHGGTVNRFIGDAIMAIWGAPLADEKHALSACLAAREMQLDMHDLRADFSTRGLPPIFMRVGVHTGPAIVGNLGAADRFDYTAIGDSVNLAARLEGVNKLYGTEILVSSVTVQQLDGALPLRMVDLVIVKGKTEAVQIFTFSDHAQINERTADALQAYRDQHWDASAALWQQILALAPDDSISSLYLARIAAFREQPPPDGWNGAVALDKL